MFTLAIIAFVSLPIITIAFQLFLGPGESWGHVVRNLLPDYTANTLILSMGCTVLTFVLGVSSAWIVSRYHFWLRRPLEWLLILPLAIPSYITAYAYAGFFDYGGTLELLFRALNIEAYKVDVMNIYGLMFVLSISLYPYVYISSRVVFRYQSSRLIEASKILGASEFKTLFRIVLPLARPAIIGGLILVLMEVLNDYGAAKYYGVPTFTTGIFRAWFSLEEPSTAIYLTAILLVVVFLFIGLERWQRGAKNFTFSLKSEAKISKLTLSKRRQFLLVVLAGFPVVFGFALPFFQLVYWCVLTFKDVASSGFYTIALQSLGIALIASFLTVIFAVLVLYVPKWNRIGILQQSSRIAVLGYAIPGAIIAIGVMIPLLSLDKWFIEIMKTYFDADIGFIINGTVFILIYAYIIRFLAVAFNPIEGGQLKLKNSLSESSRLLGKNPIKTFFNIEFPLLKPSLIGAFILVFVDVMKELPLTLILKPYQINTLAVKAYEFASDEMIMEAALPSLCIIATGIVPIILLNRLILK
jgi:iron(III) transport system permease protein